jgi:hypothetical protein
MLSLAIILLTSPPALAGGETAAEPIRAMNLCQQAEARERERPNPEVPPNLVCYTEVRPPSFWRCVLKAMDNDKSLSFGIDVCMGLMN